MNYQIHALPKAKYQHFFDMTDGELAQRNAERSVVETPNSVPCRVSLQDADPGETVILLNHPHLDEQSPYQARYAIYIRELATEAQLPKNTLPENLSRRILAIRGFSQNHRLQSADIVAGVDLETKMRALLAVPEIEYVHLHSAKEGCYHAKVVRV
ncbi:MAG: DUF1203 domain-containing protein [Gammaproteobacteria bacterium]|nr:DUF1203 domain-containing protein [Gammaproteobacteria bacterium]